MLLAQLPTSIYRIRNWFVDALIALRSRDLEQPAYPLHLGTGGQVVPADCYGPHYPQSLLDIERLYEKNRFNITRKMLSKVGRFRKEFRGIVHLERADCIPLYTLEFNLLGGTILLVFQDLEYVRDRTVRVVVQGAVSTFEYYEVLSSVADRLEYALLPRSVRIKDGGRSLQAA